MVNYSLTVELKNCPTAEILVHRNSGIGRQSSQAAAHQVTLATEINSLIAVETGSRFKEPAGVVCGEDSARVAHSCLRAVSPHMQHVEAEEALWCLLL